jgi:hypothetical protein
MIATHDVAAGVPLVSCAMCLKEVPRSEATVPEAVDYVVHFCGIDCYRQWQARAAGLGEDESATDPQARRADKNDPGG